MTIAEKVSAPETARFFTDRAQAADVDAYRRVLDKVKDAPPLLGDEANNARDKSNTP